MIHQNRVKPQRMQVDQMSALKHSFCALDEISTAGGKCEASHLHQVTRFTQVLGTFSIMVAID